MSAQKSQRTSAQKSKDDAGITFTKHSFSIRLAMEVGVEKAVLMDNMYFWIVKNRANDKNFIDGEYWSYNSAKAFGKLFPYMKPKSISRWLRELEAGGYLRSGNYNELKFDRKKWFSITKLGFSFFELSLPILRNGESENGQPIADSKPDNKQNNPPNPQGEEGVLKFAETSDPYRLANYLFQNILRNDPKFKEQNLQRWSEHTDKLIRLDGRTTEEIRSVITWSQKDDFWKSTILSTAKLRKQFPALLMKMNTPEKKPKWAPHPEGKTLRTEAYDVFKNVESDEDRAKRLGARIEIPK